MKLQCIAYVRKISSDQACKRGRQEEGKWAWQRVMCTSDSSSCKNDGVKQ